MTATELVSGVGSLPGLPGIVFRLQSAIQEEGVSFASVAQIIERDPAMTARLLKAANSAFFGVRTEVRTAEQALVLLGVHTVRNLLVVTSLHGTLRRFRLAPQFRLVRYWEHSLVTAVVAKVLALHVPRVATDDAFVCGLLHDIGKVAMASLFFDERAVVLTPSAFSDREIEQSLFGCDHTEIGAALAEQWRLPALLCEVIRHHHEPVRGPAAARVVHAADLFAHYLFPGHKDHEQFHQIPDYVAEQMTIQRSDLEEVAREAHAALAEAHAIATG